MKRYLLVIMAIVLMSSLIFVGCGAPTPAPTPAPSPAPAPTPAPSPAPAPAPSPAPAPAPAPAPTPAPKAEKPIELRFGHQNPPMGRTTVKFIDPWAKKVEAATNGRVKITMYPANSLCKADEYITAVKGNICDITWTMMAYYPGQFPLTSITELPFVNLPSGTVDGRKLSGGGVMSHILQELYETTPEIQKEWSGVKLLLLHHNDPAFLFTRDKPVRTVADMKGLKVRELGLWRSEIWKIVGATPLALPMPDVYEAAEKKVIDAETSGFSGIATFRHQEVFNTYIDVPGLVPTGFCLAMNINKWNSLPPDIQKAIISVSGMWGAEFAGEQAFGADTESETLAMAEKSGHPMKKVTFEEPAKFKELVAKQIWDKWVASTEAQGLPGRMVLDKALSLVEKYR